MKVFLVAHTPKPEQVVAMGSKLCYSADSLESIVMNDMADSEVQRRVRQLYKLGHLSPFEHASFTFGIEGVSRALLAQITRHRTGKFSVRSQRYVDESSFEFVVPKAVIENEEVKASYLEMMERISQAYAKMRELGINKEDARSILPNACTTQMLFTIDARNLLNFFKLRLDKTAQAEIRELANKMLELVKDVAPTMFEGVEATEV